MKSIKPVIGLLSLLSVICSRAQQYYVVNNQPGASANYRSLQNAIDSVPAGSVLLLQPSGTDYGSVSVGKPLVIYGAGYFLGDNTPPSTQAKLITSKIKFINFKPAAAGSMIAGIQFAQAKNGDEAVHFDTTNNITVARCFFENFAGVGQGSVPRFFSFIASSNIEIRQSYFAMTGNTGWEDGVMYTAGGVAGIVYTNNIFTGGGRLNIYGGSGDQVTFTNNTFYNHIGNHLNGNSFYNNVIIYTSDVGITEQMNAASAHNVCNKNIFPNTTNNIVNTAITVDSIFIAGSVSGITSADAYFKLKANTVAAGYGIDGKDCGAFGGSRPYVLSGLPPIPNFYAVDVTSDATQDGGLKLQLKVKANN
jgi:hypothetical protein